MKDIKLNIVTGAFGYIGKHITRQLLSKGEEVRTLTGHPNRENPFGKQITAFPLNFGNINALTDSLRGATILFNTYWIRFPYGDVTFDKAIENTKILIKAAEEAEIHRIVHISITNASVYSSLPYFRGKGLVESAIINSKLSYAIIRPTAVFGLEDILINNIAWFLRKFPLFGIPGRGDYKIQPVYVEDLAKIAVSAAQEERNIITDAVGPEAYAFEKLVQTIAQKIKSKAKIINVHPELALLTTKLIGYMVKDVVLTKDEIEGLMSGLLVSNEPPKGQTLFSNWLEDNANIIGIRYASELKRHYR